MLKNLRGEFEQILVLGWTEEGMMSAKSTSSLDIKEIIYMIEVFKSVVISAGHEVE